MHGGLSFVEQLKKAHSQHSHNAINLKRQESLQVDANMNFLQTPAGGQAMVTRESIRGG